MISALRQSREQRLELEFRFLELASSDGIGHHAYACIKPRAILPQQAAAERDRELSISIGIDPAHGARVPTPLHRLELVDQRVGGGPRPAPDGGSGVERSEERR